MTSAALAQQPISLATLAPSCTAPSECMAEADAQAKWGSGGYIQNGRTACYQLVMEKSTVSFYCFQRKTVAINNPPVTTTVTYARLVTVLPVTTAYPSINKSLIAADTDKDGFVDIMDNCDEIYNPGQEDFDKDGAGDDCDNCMHTPNPEQEDADGDRIGDVCDLCPADKDPSTAGSIDDREAPGYIDSDNDGVGDRCDLCPLLPDKDLDDSDGDGVGDVCDNCRNIKNTDQKDSDSDCVYEPKYSSKYGGAYGGDPGGKYWIGVMTCGDACDWCPGVINKNATITCTDCSDPDKDGKASCIDNCPKDANSGQEDTNTNGIGDVCDTCEKGTVFFNSVYPIQVMDSWGHPLVEGKSTVFKAVITSTYPCDKLVNFTLTLPEDQWGTTGWKSGLFPRQSFPHTSGPVLIPAKASGYAVYLPYIAPDKVEENASILKSDNIGRVVRFPIATSPGPGLQGIAKQIRPDFRVMPVPIKTADGKAHYRVDITPVKELPGNSPTPPYQGSVDVIVTSSWKFLLVHEKFKTYASNPKWTDPGEKASLERILATYPIADDAITATVMPTVGNAVCERTKTPSDICPYTYDHDVVPGDPEQVSYARYVYLTQTAAKWGYDVGVGISPWGGQYNPNTQSMTVNPDERYWMFAHEFTHFAVPMGDVPFYMENCTRFEKNIDGYWVNAYTRIEDTPYFMDGPSGNNWMIGPSTKSLNQANAACMYDINFFYGGDPNTGGMNSDGYYNMLSNTKFFVTDPEGLLVSGTVYRNGTADLQPFSILPSTVLDVAPGSRGAYTFVLYDSAGKELSSSGFDLSFIDLKPDNPKNTMIPRERDYAPFVRIIEWKSGTHRIDLKDSRGTVLATRIVSSSPPSVRIISPNGGETWTLGEAVTVKWAGSDPDGGNLTYDIGISGDGGKTWIPLAGNRDGTEFTLKPGGLYGGNQYRIKVIASDGVNVGEATSAGNFSIIDPEDTTGSLSPPLAVFGGLIVVFVIAFSAGWYFLKKKKPN